MKVNQTISCKTLINLSEKTKGIYLFKLIGPGNHGFYLP